MHYTILCIILDIFYCNLSYDITLYIQFCLHVSLLQVEACFPLTLLFMLFFQFGATGFGDHFLHFTMARSRIVGFIGEFPFIQIYPDKDRLIQTW